MEVNYVCVLAPIGSVRALLVLVTFSFSRCFFIELIPLKGYFKFSGHQTNGLHLGVK